ncbi:DNA-binding protein [Phascolarctobacterium sp.]
MMNAQEVAAALSVSVTMAYKVIRQLNAELKAKGKIVVRGKVNRRYFQEKTYQEGA